MRKVRKDLREEKLRHPRRLGTTQALSPGADPINTHFMAGKSSGGFYTALKVITSRQLL